MIELDLKALYALPPKDVELVMEWDFSTGTGYLMIVLMKNSAKKALQYMFHEADLYSIQFPAQYLIEKQIHRMISQIQI